MLSNFTKAFKTPRRTAFHAPEFRKQKLELGRARATNSGVIHGANRSVKPAAARKTWQGHSRHEENLRPSLTETGLPRCFLFHSGKRRLYERYSLFYLRKLNW